MVCEQLKCLPIGLAKICLITSFEPHARRHFRSQLLLHRFKLRATGVAELSQWIFAVHRAKLDLFGSEIRLRISGHNGLTSSAFARTLDDELSRMGLRSA